MYLRQSKIRHERVAVHLHEVDEGVRVAAFLAPLARSEPVRRSWLWPGWRFHSSDEEFRVPVVSDRAWLSDSLHIFVHSSPSLRVRQALPA